MDEFTRHMQKFDEFTQHMTDMDRKHARIYKNKLTLEEQDNETEMIIDQPSH
jgi:hypothetical protein